MSRMLGMFGTQIINLSRQQSFTTIDLTSQPKLLDEKLYERAMIIELKYRGHVIAVQSSFPVSYRGALIGNLIPDLIVDDAVIVDAKVASCFTDTHVAQMIGYLNITRLDLAILIN